jgi:hypothetical protein
MKNEITTSIHPSIICQASVGSPLKYSKSWMIFLTAMKTNERDRSIHDKRYLVSFTNLRAMTAAIIWSMIEMIRATSLTMKWFFVYTKIGEYFMGKQIFAFYLFLPLRFENS